MTKPLYVVRVCVSESTEAWHDNPLLECLRCAGIVNVHATRTPLGRQVYDIFPPRASWSASKNWAEANAERMRTYGINAQACPSTKEVNDVEQAERLE